MQNLLSSILAPCISLILSSNSMDICHKQITYLCKYIHNKLKSLRQSTERPKFPLQSELTSWIAGKNDLAGWKAPSFPYRIQKETGLIKNWSLKEYFCQLYWVGESNWPFYHRTSLPWMVPLCPAHDSQHNIHYLTVQIL